MMCKLIVSRWSDDSKEEVKMFWHCYSVGIPTEARKKWSSLLHLGSQTSVLERLGSGERVKYRMEVDESLLVARFLELRCNEMRSAWIHLWHSWHQLSRVTRRVLPSYRRRTPRPSDLGTSHRSSVWRGEGGQQCPGQLRAQRNDGGALARAQCRCGVMVPGAGLASVMGRATWPPCHQSPPSSTQSETVKRGGGDHVAHKQTIGSG